MKTLRLAWLGLTLLAVAAAPAAAETIRFGVAAEPYPPFASKTPAGKWEGFEIDLIKRLCTRMKAECVIKEVAWDGIIPALNAKKIDVIFASMSITEERAKQIAFSKPYYDTPVALVAAKTAAITATPDGFKGKTIGAQVGTTSADWLKAKFTGVAAFKFYDTQEAANADLLAGRIDALVADAIPMADFVKTAEAKAAGLESKGNIPYDPLFGSGIGAGLRKADKVRLAKLDAAIAAELADPAYDKLAIGYFGMTVRPKP